VSECVCVFVCGHVCMRGCACVGVFVYTHRHVCVYRNKPTPRFLRRLAADKVHPVPTSSSSSLVYIPALFVRENDSFFSFFSFSPFSKAEAVLSEVGTGLSGGGVSAIVGSASQSSVVVAGSVP